MLSALRDVLEVDVKRVAFGVMAIGTAMAMGCGGSECPAGSVMSGDRCVTEEIDAGTDAGEPVDVGPTRDVGQLDAFVSPDSAVDAFRPVDAPQPDACVTATYYADSDGDTFGDPSASMTGCVMPSGYVANSMDCDDEEVAINPGATEICNGADDDCADGIDEGVQTSFFQDMDNDTYGSAVIRMACAVETGLATRSGDCNDANNAIYPTALETCDGIDNDCDTVSDGPSANFWCGQPAQLASLSAVSAVCASSACQATSCAAMRGNCDSMGACETDTSTSAANCGACGTVCAWNRCGSSVCNDAVQISAGGNHTCALRRDGTVVCWGANDYGQLGSGPAGSYTTTPVVVSGLAGVQAISAGRSHTCALAASGAVSCWGHGAEGRLGDGTTTNRTSPVLISGLPASARQISAGGTHTCAVLATGATYCWGSNFYGQLGDGTTTNRLVPTLIPGSNSSMVSAGLYHTCALAAGSNLLFCWGQNNYGQVGDGTGTNRLSPTYSSAFGAVQSVSASAAFTCVVSTTGGVRCVGLNDQGQLGSGTTTSTRTPVTVTGLSTVVELRTGYATTYVRLSDGTIRAWGGNYAGQLGDGTTTNRLVPTIVVGSSVELTAGERNACYRGSTGVVRCWGYNDFGGVGDGTFVQRNSPTTVVAP